MVAQKIGFLFPGQGAQYVGMGKDAASQFPSVKKLYDQADRILGIPLSRHCFEGPEETLTRTLYAQPAIFVTSLALFFLFQEKFTELKPHLVAGLSLGEFSALVAGGSLSFSEGLKLVWSRAESMEEAASENPGTMVSIMGLNLEECTALAKESGAQLANLNAPDQFVLSGTEPSVNRAAELADQMGAKRALRLKVSGAFHSSLMEPARQRFSGALKKVTFQKPRCLFIPNVTGTPEPQPEKIRLLLAEQLTHPVRWIETIQCAKKQGMGHFVELGPGRVLKGLAKRIDPALEVLSFEKAADLETLESALIKV